ncbi:MAG: phosphoribosyltransferase [Thermoprotei archaeon]|nr:MAG: phosphoribosyltransferase [Thermoprotei archaeon]
MKIRCIYITWERATELCRVLSHKIRNEEYIPDVIIAVARGGYVPARLLCDYLGVTDLVSLQIEYWRTAVRKKEPKIRNPLTVNLHDKRVLLVDDVADTGETLKVASNYVMKCCNPREVKTAVLHYKSSSCKYPPNFYAEEVREWVWVIYPWEFYEDVIDLLTTSLKERNIAEVSLDQIQRIFEEDYDLILSKDTVKSIAEEMVLRKLATYVNENIIRVLTTA